MLELAEERIHILMDKSAERIRNGEKQLSQRYIELARRINEKTQIGIPSELQKKFCSNCNSFLIPGKNCRIRINSDQDQKIYHCKNCGSEESHGY